MLLAFTLLLGLAVPASADYNYRGHEYNPDNDVRPFTQVAQGNTQEAMSTAKYYSMSNSNLFLIAYYIYRNLDDYNIRNYLYDQKQNASLFPLQYLAYSLHGLKGSITSSGNIIASNDLGSDSKDYFLTRWVNMNSNATITDFNRWRIQTLSDNSQYSWLYQVASGAGSMQLLTDALMNWSNPNFGMYSPADTANYSWFNQVLSSVRDNKLDVSGLATEATLSSLNGKVATETTLSGFTSMFKNRYQTVIYDFDATDGFFVSGAIKRYNFADTVAYQLANTSDMLYNMGNLLFKLDEVLTTENDRALEKATDDTKVTVKDYVSDKKSNYGDSFTIGNTISDGLKPDLSTSQASSAVGGLFSQSSSDYYGWFSSETDNDLHPGASGASTLSLEDEPSSQDVADSETVWVIDPYASSSDLISDFFGGD